MSGPPQLEVLAPGAYASVQDLGRRGYRRDGVPWAGVLDARQLRVANALVGNPGDAPVIEGFDGGLQLAARGGAVRIAVAGDAVLEWEHAGERQAPAAWRSLTLADGDVLRIKRLARGRTVAVAVEGLALPKVLGSASTYARAALGGVDGRALVAGVKLPAAPASARLEQMLGAALPPAGGPIRVVAGPQAEHFDTAAHAAFAATDWRVSTEADRMGVRLEGPPLAHVGKPEIVTDATVPGSIQVPGSGQPIVLLADAQTAGGYPKIGTVIGADLARVAALQPGQTLRFAFVDAAEGERLARAAEAETRRLLASLRPLLVGGVDAAALYDASLVSGMIDALAPHEPAAPAPPTGDPP